MADTQAGDATAYKTLLVQLAQWLEHFYVNPIAEREDWRGCFRALRSIQRVRHT
jgi:hypothetical protein